MTAQLSRLFQPKSIAIVGGGAWCRAVTEQVQKAGFAGEIWPVHPRHDAICGLPAYAGVPDLPGAPDAAFVGINRDATIGVIERLARIGAGGAVCFASGFQETEDGSDANARLLHAAGDMPILGPNCYGFVNALDGASLWPDQHGCQPVERGVAILTQSSNIAINLSMQKRALPIAYLVTCGNQAQLSMAQIADGLLDDPRVTAIGLHIEGFSDLPEWQSFARRAHALGKPVVALKVGKSEEAQAATVSHTASLAGSDAGADALLKHLGIARVDGLPTLLETLKLLHINGPLASTRIASISCSGGEASLIADMAHDTPLTFPPLTEAQRSRLGAVLGPKVALANPLDYHTYIWRDTDAMTRTFSAMLEPDLALTLIIVDFPRKDICDAADWECAIQAALGARFASTAPIAMVATLPELMPEDVAKRLLDAGITPFNGLQDAIAACCAAQPRTPEQGDIVLPPPAQPVTLIPEADAKTELAAHGLSVPAHHTGSVEDVVAALTKLSPPYVLKSVEQAHKSESGGVKLNLTSPDEVSKAAEEMGQDMFHLEEMVQNAVAELIIGVVKDPAHGFVLTLGMGGVYTELLNDACSMVLPTTPEAVKQSLTQLKMAPLLTGYRNQPSADLDAIIAAVMAVQSYVLANLDKVEEVEINPLIATPTNAIAADALIRRAL